jgi:hypothetical protein
MSNFGLPGFPESLSFNFSINDADFKSYSVIVSSEPGNLIEHAFIRTPIYDDFGIQIGYKTSDDYIQQLSDNEYGVRISNTYFIQGKGTINWSYNFVNNLPSYYYPVDKIASSNITSTTGDYIGKTGFVYLNPVSNGTRYVKIVLF